MIAALRDYAPGAKIDVIVLRSSSKELFQGLSPMVDEVIYLRYWEAGRAAFIRDLLQARRHRQYDASFLCYPAARFEYQILSAAFRARRRYSHQYSGNGRLFRLLFRQVGVAIGPEHNVLRNMGLLKAAGLPFSEPVGYTVPGNWKSGRAVERRIAFHAGSINHDAFALKRWPEQSFADLARRWKNRGYEIWFVAGPDERIASIALADAVGAKVFEGSLPELAHFLRTCKLMVANDTGVAHLAAGLGTPVVALFGPTPIEGGPYGPRTLRLRPSTCPPCFTPELGIPECPKKLNFACLRESLSLDYVDAALRVFNDQLEG